MYLAPVYRGFFIVHVQRRIMTEILTPHRRRIYEVLTSATCPLSANDLLLLVGSTINLATIYRALQYLETTGLVEGFTTPCALESSTRYYWAVRQEHIHFFHCNQCHRFFPIDGCTLDQISKEFQDNYGHQVERHQLLFVGCCKECLVDPITSDYESSGCIH
jgi:Fur family ferric uptake transcriptional regulator